MIIWIEVVNKADPHVGDELCQVQHLLWHVDERRYFLCVPLTFQVVKYITNLCEMTCAKVCRY